MTATDIINAIALTRIPGLGIVGIYHLISAMQSATEIFRNREHLPELVPGVSRKVVTMLDCPEAFRRAEAEYDFLTRNGIRCLTFDCEDYPSRLRECPDAPSLLYYRGNADLNKQHVVSIVGTRHATTYGQDTCAKLVRELAECCPDIIVVSGLAYGTDINAHRSALDCGLETVAVLAHGLDRIYPYTHRKTASDMIEQGGLITEYMSGTMPDKPNFVQRNRIVAGMSDVTIVIESAEKGGALITADLAESYHRDCYAIPGRINDVYSVGCNRLIQSNKAALLCGAQQLAENMNWILSKPKPQATQGELCFDLSDEEQNLVEILKKHPDGAQINLLTVKSGLPVNRVATLLFGLEMRGIVKTMAGANYRLIL